MPQHSSESWNAPTVVSSMDTAEAASTLYQSRQTRECMKVSMSAIKTKRLPLPTGEVIEMPEGAIPIMEEARDLYQKMKTRDEAAYDEFFALSTAHFHVLGKEIIDEKFVFFRKHFEDVFTNYWIEAGEEYIYEAAGFCPN